MLSRRRVNRLALGLVCGAASGGCRSRSGSVARGAQPQPNGPGGNAAPQPSHAAGEVEPEPEVSDASEGEGAQQGSSDTGAEAEPQPALDPGGDDEQMPEITDASDLSQEKPLIVFAGRVQSRREDAEAAPIRIHVMRMDGRRRRRLTKGSAWEFDPAWSPDRKQIAYTRIEKLGDGRANIWVMQADGSRPRQLTNHSVRVDGLAISPAWSPDGKSLVYSLLSELDVSHDLSVKWRLAVINLEGGKPRMLCPGGQPSWSPDGKQILYMTLPRPNGVPTPQLEMVDVEQPTRTRLFMKEAIDGAWSPDGKAIAYSKGHDGIFIVDSAGRKARRLTRIGREKNELDTMPQWTPDGRHIVFTRWNNEGPFAPSESMIHVVDVAGTKTRQVSPDESMDLLGGEKILLSMIAAIDPSK